MVAMSAGTPGPLDASRPEDAGMSSEGLRYLRDLVHQYVDDGRYPGTVCVVARRDRVVFADAYGGRDAERQLPMELDTIFRIYSMTKPVASVALMQLYEKGCFQLNDPVDAYLPEFSDPQVFDRGTPDDYTTRPATRSITVRDLLMHTSGLVAPFTRSSVGALYRRHGIGSEETDHTLASMVETLGRIPLETDPGSTWIYGISTDVVGRLVEVLSGQAFGDYLAEHVFEPLGMVDTGFEVPAEKLDRLAAGYQRCAGTPAYTLLDDPKTSRYATPARFQSGSAGLVSTAADYLRFSRMLARSGTLGDARILGERTLRFMRTNHLPAGRDLTSMARHGGESQREGHGFGLGFGVLLDPVVAQTIGTPGEFFWGGAGSTAFFISPEDDLIVIFLTQLRPSASYPIRRQLRAAAYGAVTA